jgi:membrane protease YdiL (CAAX protease family)
MTTPAKPQENIHTPPQVPNIIRVSSLIYGVMTIVGLILMRFAHQNLPALGLPTASEFSIGILIAIGLLTAGVLLSIGYFFEDFFPSYRYFRAVMMQTLGRVSLPSALYLSMISSIGEEIFFRGGLQPFAGLALTSILFGLMHIGPDGRGSAWSIWAAIAGVLLGWSFEETGSLLPAFIGHFTVNAYGILRLRREYQRFQAVAPEFESDDADKPS